MMFWGLNLKANRKYTQTTSKSFHISQAALDSETSDGGANQIFISCDNQKFLVCTLRKDVCEQAMLDFNFAEGEEICFQSKGSGNVSLTGYIVENDPMDFMNGDEEDSEIEDQEEDLRAALNKKLKGQKKVVAVAANQDDDEDEDDDDEDEDEDEDGADDDDGEDDEIGDGEEEDDDEDDDADDDDEDGDSEEEIVQPEVKKVKLDKPQKQQNGVAKDTAADGAPGDKKNKKKEKKEKQQQQQQQKPAKQAAAAGGEKVLSGGVKIDDLRVGTGPEVKQGKRAQVFYEGRLKSNNKVFDSLKQGAGFKFVVGRGEVIKGWDIGIAGMKVGGKRRITCPPHMAYGPRGSPPAIPPNSTLVFEVELKGVN